MSQIDPLDEQRSVRLRQRLWGAAVLIALLVIFLPLILDGSGSESQYRRVERLRAEPPRILDADGNPESGSILSATPVATKTLAAEPATAAQAEQPITLPETTSETAANSTVEQPVPSPAAQPTEQVMPTAQPNVDLKPESLSAWVVQAGSFSDEQNALAVRDRLRRAGYPSFVTPTEAGTVMYRVRVGPMINLQQAEANRDKVMQLLDREAIVVSYP